MDRRPKKACKHCGLWGHYAYSCYHNPKRAVKKLKLTPIRKIGKQTKQWFVTRDTWIRKNPAPIDGRYWMCYLQIHPWCPRYIDINRLTLDHVVSRSRDPSKRFKSDNLKPACRLCNNKKGSRPLDQIKPSAAQ